MYYPLSLAQLIGLFGFAYWRRIGGAMVWRIVFLASILHEGWELFATATNADLWNAGHEDIIALTILGGVLLYGPMLIALFLYGFRCRDLWRRDTPAPS